MSEIGKKPCVCGSGKGYFKCCEPIIDGRETAPTAEALMRSRYTGYTLRREDYLLATWHHSTRPASLDLTKKASTKWLGLDIKRANKTAETDDHATVEFIARYKSGSGRAERLHEFSHFVRENGRWFYIDGEMK